MTRDAKGTVAMTSDADGRSAVATVTVWGTNGKGGTTKHGVG